MSRELLQQALDALKYHTEHTYPFHLTNVAIEALQKALAQPEQESEAYRYVKRLAEFIWAKHYKEESPDWTPLPDVLGVLTQIDNMTCGLELAKPEQEPVAWMTNSEHEYSIDYKFNWLQTPLHNIPLYTAPPRKPWQGLTDDEVDLILWQGVFDAKDIRTIEAKLKEKNSAL